MCSIRSSSQEVGGRAAVIFPHFKAPAPTTTALKVVCTGQALSLSSRLGPQSKRERASSEHFIWSCQRCDQHAVLDNLVLTKYWYKQLYFSSGALWHSSCVQFFFVSISHVWSCFGVARPRCYSMQIQNRYWTHVLFFMFHDGGKDLWSSLRYHCHSLAFGLSGVSVGTATNRTPSWWSWFNMKFFGMSQLETNQIIHWKCGETVKQFLSLTNKTIVQHFCFYFVACGNLTWSNSVHDGNCHRERVIVCDNFNAWKTENIDANRAK